MFRITPREQAALTTVERMRCNIDKLVGEHSDWLQQSLHRNNNRMIRQAIDEAESDGEMQMYLDRRE